MQVRKIGIDAQVLAFRSRLSRTSLLAVDARDYFLDPADPPVLFVPNDRGETFMRHLFIDGGTISGKAETGMMLNGKYGGSKKRNNQHRWQLLQGTEKQIGPFVVEKRCWHTALWLVRIVAPTPLPLLSPVIADQTAAGILAAASFGEPRVNDQQIMATLAEKTSAASFIAELFLGGPQVNGINRIQYIPPPTQNHVFSQREGKEARIVDGNAALRGIKSAHACAKEAIVSSQESGATPAKARYSLWARMIPCRLRGSGSGSPVPAPVQVALQMTSAVEFPSSHTSSNSTMLLPQTEVSRRTGQSNRPRSQCSRRRTLHLRQLTYHRNEALPD